MDTFLPIILSHTLQSTQHVLLEMRAQAELEYFNGHFPEAAIVPGVAQIHWAEKLGRRFLQGLPEAEGFYKLEAIKFQQLIRPGQTFQLEIKYLADKNALYFWYFFNDTQFSTGRLLYRCQANEF